MNRLTLFGLLLSWGSLAAQTTNPANRAVAGITAEAVARHIGVIADDSMMGRDTPSRGLELTAEYVAAEFARAGLLPGGEGGTWFQRYPITHRRLDLARSQVGFRAGAVVATAALDRDARYLQGVGPQQPVRGPVLLVGGSLTPGDLTRVRLRDRVVLFVPGGDRSLPTRDARVGRALRLAGPKAVIMVSSLDSAGFADRLPRRVPPRTAVDLGAPNPPFVEVNRSVVAAALLAAGVDPTSVGASPTPVMREVPGLTIEVALADSVLLATSAPNTIGILEGSDPRLKHEFLIYSAHMDHIGISPGQRDSINNGADDDASGTAGVIELAKAFAQPGARPKRSIVFLTVSGEEKGLWGSRYFSEHPTVPLDRVVADFNIDMIGRNWRDTIVAIGKEHSDLGATLQRVNRAHPELGITAIDDRWPEERFYFRSDHYNFARKGVPVLFFFNGVHPDYHRPTDSAEKIDSEKEGRILRLLFFLGREVANAPRRPRWNPESYRAIVEAPDAP